jgi:hypothetical protein
MLEWNVFYHNPNSNKIQIYNIFHHNGFRNDVFNIFAKYEEKEKVDDELRLSLMYHFWAKCEWETIISPFIGDKEKESIKVDVYWQVMNNWKAFVGYVWSHMI